MSKHLFGLVVTHHGTAANNRGETEGNITTLQKILWKGDVHTTVSAEAIRYAIRWYWQRVAEAQKHKLNRTWDDKADSHKWEEPDFGGWDGYLDDDVLGFMSAKAGKEEGNEEEAGKDKKKPRVRGTCDKRRARLEVTRAISLTPFAGDITFNAASVGATPSASSTGKDPVPYGTEVHATRYQYGFALTPEDLHDKSRALAVLDAIVNLSEVAGNHARFLYDFSPESIILRWTDDFAPRMLYCFQQEKDGSITVPRIIEQVEAGDIHPAELVFGGPVASDGTVSDLMGQDAHLVAGVKDAVAEVKSRIKKDLGL
jgi:CRISPR-associated protein Cst2